MLFRNDKKDNRDATTNVVPLFPLRELIVFPHEVYPIFVGRQKSIKALEAAAGSWKDKDHPELKHGAAEWVDELRREDEKRFQKVTAR